MTIKELEQRTGMARANIRFYEGEGLLSPRRLDNGYRDYSEEDERTLEKIKLLRQLQLDIDTIRKVQAGVLTLEQALFTQATRLEGDRAVIERALEVCRELERSGVEYAALDPQPWLSQLEPPRRTALPAQPVLPPSPEEEEERDVEPRACYCPWQRLFARSLDMALYDTLINLAWLLAFRDQSFLRFQTVPFFAALCGMALLALTLALEPLWLHCWGWTPGKWVFGLKLRNRDGSKLSLAQGWARSWALAGEGYGWNIPLWNLWRMWRGRAAGLEGRDGPWDSEYGYRRYTKVDRRFSAPAFVAARAALAGVVVLASLWSAAPPCRGELTVGEFTENYGHFACFLDSSTGTIRMDRDGRWVEADGQPGGTIQVKVGEAWVEADTPRWDEPEFTLEDGHVKAVTLRVWGGYLDSVPNSIRETVAALALSGSTDGWRRFGLDIDGWQEAVSEVLGRCEDGETEYRGLRIVQRVEMTGYEEGARGFPYFMTPILEERQRFERTVTISLTE